MATTHAPATTASMPASRLLSLGAGVQSTIVLLLACDGAIPRFDYAIFADTQWESRAVYHQLEKVRGVAAKAGIPVLTVSAGHIRRDAVNASRRFVTMPLHVRNPDGSKGLARRQCTGEYKIKPLKAAARALLGYPTRTASPPEYTQNKPSVSVSTRFTAPKTPMSATCATCFRCSILACPAKTASSIWLNMDSAKP